MKSFENLVDETLHAEDIEELEAAADLFDFGIEKGYYTKRQTVEFNNIYWRVKNKFLAREVAREVKGNILDITSMVAHAPVEVKENIDELKNYIKGRYKALKGKAL